MATPVESPSILRKGSSAACVRAQNFLWKAGVIFRNIIAALFCTLFFVGCDRDLSVGGIYFPRWMALVVLTALPAFLISAWLRKKVPEFDPWWFEITRLSVWAVLFFPLELFFAIF